AAAGDVDGRVAGRIDGDVVRAGGGRLDRDGRRAAVDVDPVGARAADRDRLAATVVDDDRIGAVAGDRNRGRAAAHRDGVVAAAGDGHLGGAARTDGVAAVAVDRDGGIVADRNGVGAGPVDRDRARARSGAQGVVARAEVGGDRKRDRTGDRNGV